MLRVGMACKCFPACHFSSSILDCRREAVTGRYDPEFATHIYKRHSLENSLTLASDSAIMQRLRWKKTKEVCGNSDWATRGHEK
jgi:hypothetical protein